MPRKHIQSAKTNSSSWPSTLHMTDNRSTTFLWQECSQGLNDGATWSYLPESVLKQQQSGRRIRNVFFSQEAVYLCVCVHLQIDKQIFNIGAVHVYMLNNATSPTLTFLSKTRIVAHISVKSSKSPHACQNKRPLEWQASTVCVTSACLRQKDGLSRAGGRPKMTWHWSQRYRLCSFFDTKAYFSLVTKIAKGKMWKEGLEKGGGGFESRGRDTSSRLWRRRYLPEFVLVQISKPVVTLYHRCTLTTFLLSLLIGCAFSGCTCFWYLQD